MGHAGADNVLKYVKIRTVLRSFKIFVCGKCLKYISKWQFLKKIHMNTFIIELAHGALWRPITSGTSSRPEVPNHRAAQKDFYFYFEKRSSRSPARGRETSAGLPLVHANGKLYFYGLFLCLYTGPWKYCFIFYRSVAQKRLGAAVLDHKHY